jgi:hypothetical protein
MPLSEEISDKIDFYKIKDQKNKRPYELSDMATEEYNKFMKEGIEVPAGHNITDIDLLVSAVCSVRKYIETILITYSSLPFSSGQRLDDDIIKKLLHMEYSLLETIIPFLEPDIYSTQKIHERLSFVRPLIKQMQDYYQQEQEEILLNKQKEEDERIFQEKVAEMYKE